MLGQRWVLLSERAIVLNWSYVQHKLSLSGVTFLLTSWFLNPLILVFRAAGGGGRGNRGRKAHLTHTSTEG